MKKAMTILLLVPVMATGCASVPAQDAPAETEVVQNVTEQADIVSSQDDFSEEDAFFDPLDAIKYNGTVYYGLLMGLDEIPDGATEIGTASQKCAQCIIPSAEMEVTWCNAGQTIYAQTDENGVPTNFYCEFDGTNDAGTKVLWLADVTTSQPEYYK